MRCKRALHIILLTLLPLCLLNAKNHSEATIISRVFAQAARLDSIGRKGLTFGVYAKYSIKTNRRNVLLMTVPTLFNVARDEKREHVGEMYQEVEIDDKGAATVKRRFEHTTLPRRRIAMPAVRQYLTPNIYGERLIDNHILSPFNRKNRKYYRYQARVKDEGTATLTFKPKIDNTQLVRGSADVDIVSGRIMDLTVQGEYDMVNFKLYIRMGEHGLQAYYPCDCELTARFKLFGNDVSCSYQSTRCASMIVPDSLGNMPDSTLLNSIRPLPLSAHEQAVFDDFYTPRDTVQLSDTTQTKKKSAVKDVLKYIGKHLVARTKEKFGANDQMSVRLNPLLNPLYFGYSGSRGLVYKLDFRAAYTFSSNSEISMRFKAGYSFKQKRMYFQLPMAFYFDKRHDGFVELEVGNGKRIRNSQAAEKIQQARADTIDWEAMGLHYFNDFYYRLVVGRNLSHHVSAEIGLMKHERTALNKAAYEEVGLLSRYSSVAPTIEIKYYPRHIRNSVLTIDYERSIKGLLGANLEYERFELYWQHIISLTAMSSLQIRAGTGFYTRKGSDWIFLDYSNFHEQNIPNGWYDDWACNFELLDSKWYNASEYYVRGNLTYESPLLILSRLPLAGRFMEKERVYINTLFVKHLHPYIEYGYGFKTRLFSLGAFIAQRNWSYDGVGVKFGFEIFRDW